jgi:hypothetical protein
MCMPMFVKDEYAWLTWALAFILVWENKRRSESSNPHFACGVVCLQFQAKACCYGNVTGTLISLSIKTWILMRKFSAVLFRASRQELFSHSDWISDEKNPKEYQTFPIDATNSSISKRL